MPLRLPATLDRLRSAAETSTFADRDTVILELTLLNGFRPSEIAALDMVDVKIATPQIRRRMRGCRPRWQPLLIDNVASWTRLCMRENVQADAAFLETWQGSRISRVDVWRILRGLGTKAGIKKPVHARRIRKILAYTLARRHAQRAELVADVLALKGLQGVSAFLPRTDWSPFTELREPR